MAAQGRLGAPGVAHDGARPCAHAPHAARAPGGSGRPCQPAPRRCTAPGRQRQQQGRRAAQLAQRATAADEAPSTSVGADSAAPTAATWELDFSSRPVLDERGKKRWELLICSPDRTWTFARYFPNNKINSSQLKLALEEVLARPGAVRPKAVRFFRAQMQTIITRALADLDIRALPSRRCFTLLAWLEERLEGVYKKDPGFSDKAGSLFVLDLGPPEKLPDALRGERWSFVQLPLGALREELRAVQQASVFGDSVPLAEAGCGDLADDALIPGVAVYSARSQPLAAWTQGYDLANLTADLDRACLVLETGVNQRWRYGGFRRTPENVEEAGAWEAAKRACRGLHFLAVQKDEDAEQFEGLWLLLDRELPKI